MLRDDRNSLRRPRTLGFVLSAAVCAVALAAPFLAVTLPPITDLPQQVAQIRLLQEALAGGGEHTVRWAEPNKLGYLPLLVGWLAGGPLAAGRLGMVLVALSWVAALHAAAHAAGRPPAAAAAATIFFFNHTLYWGFLNFLVGFPVFLFWLIGLRRLPAATTSLRGGLGLGAGAALLYSAHVLWLAAGLAAFAVAGALGRWRRGAWLGRLAWIAPPLAAAALWYPRLAAGGFDSDTVWGHGLGERLHPGWLLGSVFGGLRGGVEATLALALAGWLLLGWWQSRGERAAAAGGFDRGFLGTAALLFAAALALPGVHQHTIFFASRWLPPAAALFVLACPPPRLRPLLRLGFPLLLVIALAAATAAAWIGFERNELDGLLPALERLPPEPRVLGLDFVRTSERLEGYPFYHLYAYAQVLRGGELNRSFANEVSSLVTYRDLPRRLPWTDGLDWRARRLRRSDLDHFDHAIVHAGADLHALFEADPRLEALTGNGVRPWRLYRIRPATDP